MAFFNLTHLGPQDPFKTASQIKTENENSVSVADGASADSANTCTSSQLPSHYNTMYAPDPNHSWHKGSHLKYTEMLKKHQKSPEGTCNCHLIN